MTGWRAIRPPALAAIDAAARATPRTRVLAGSVEAGMITYVTRSRLWAFPDYTTVAVAPAGAAGDPVLTLLGPVAVRAKRPGGECGAGAGLDVGLGRRHAGALTSPSGPGDVKAAMIPDARPVPDHRAVRLPRSAHGRGSVGRRFRHRLDREYAELRRWSMVVRAYRALVVRDRGGPGDAGRSRDGRTGRGRTARTARAPARAGTGR